jgi:fused signal recognition particle receptor
VAVESWPVPQTPEEPPSAGLDAGLERTRGGFMSRLRGFLGGNDAAGPSWDDVEETLIAGDVGASLAIQLVEHARARRDTDGPEAAIRAELAALLVPRDVHWTPRPATGDGPAVVLVVGVNGTGKTTTIGKLASRYAWTDIRSSSPQPTPSGAAAIDQLRIWADRANVPMIAHAPGADPGAVVYDALDAAVARGADLVIADTAGRLHTRTNLMDELSKVRRIVDKRLPGAEPETSSCSTRPGRTAGPGEASTRPSD